VLFGSAARGTMGPDSDLDVLVVAPAGAHRRRTAQSIYRALAGLGHATDIVVVTEEDIRHDRGKIGSIVTPALDEGRDLYDASV
jgi:predicted nucleotidyltransferase